ncbi:MAG: DUF971 domain-containing protein [Nitrospinota bacterium]|nr:DUF971 domain-containing protein [Nitrospinota bacterium]
MDNETRKPIDLTVDKKDSELRIVWNDGARSFYTFDYLASMCPCANCKEKRYESQKNPLNVLSGTIGPAQLQSADMVGRYAINFSWSGGCSSGIYSFDYLDEIDPDKENSGSNEVNSRDL